MKKIITLLFLSILMASCTQSKEKQDLSFRYTGINWDKYEGHTIDIVVGDTTIAGVHSVTDKVIIKNGTFKISDTLKQIRNAYFGLYSPEGKYVYKQEFILEPGELELDL
ncbi:hypothetical protein, partial [Flavivirga rizhaonensis]